MDFNAVALACIKTANTVSDGHPLGVLDTMAGICKLTEEERLGVHRVLYRMRSSIPYHIPPPKGDGEGHKATVQVLFPWSSERLRRQRRRWTLKRLRVSMLYVKFNGYKDLQRLDTSDDGEGDG